MGALDASDENPANELETNIAGASGSWNTNEDNLDDLDFEFDTFGTSSGVNDYDNAHFGSFDTGADSISFGDSSQERI